MAAWRSGLDLNETIAEDKDDAAVFDVDEHNAAAFDLDNGATFDLDEHNAAAFDLDNGIRPRQRRCVQPRRAPHR